VLLTASAYSPLAGQCWYELLSAERNKQGNTTAAASSIPFSIVFRQGCVVRLRVIPQRADAGGVQLFAVHIERVDGAYDERLVYLNRLLKSAAASTLPKVDRRVSLHVLHVHRSTNSLIPPMQARYRRLCRANRWCPLARPQCD
jgi:hypothetical protein